MYSDIYCQRIDTIEEIANCPTLILSGIEINNLQKTSQHHMIISYMLVQPCVCISCFCAQYITDNCDNSCLVYFALSA